MIKTPTILLGTGLLLASLAAPLAARADHDDRTLAFVIGAAVGHALGDNDVHVRHVHRGYHGPGPNVRQWRWHQRHKALQRKWHRDHRKFHRHERFEHRRDHRRHERHDWRDRGHDRRRHDDRDRWDGRRHG